MSANRTTPYERAIAADNISTEERAKTRDSTSQEERAKEPVRMRTDTRPGKASHYLRLII